MKINENFVLRQLADTYVVLPLGEATVSFNGILTLNGSGVLLWNCLEKGADREDLVKALTDEYDVSAEEAAKDVEEFIATLQKTGCIED